MFFDFPSSISMNNYTEKHISEIKICLDNLQSSTNTFPIEVTDTLMKIVQSYYDKLVKYLVSNWLSVSLNQFLT